MCEQCNSGNNNQQTHIVLPVSGMSCGHCAQSLESGLAKLPGVEGIKADHLMGTVSFTLTAGGDLATVKQTIEDLGFEV